MLFLKHSISVIWGSGDRLTAKAQSGVRNPVLLTGLIWAQPTHPTGRTSNKENCFHSNEVSRIPTAKMWVWFLPLAAQSLTPIFSVPQITSWAAGSKAVWSKDTSFFVTVLHKFYPTLFHIKLMWVFVPGTITKLPQSRLSAWIRRLQHTLSCTWSHSLLNSPCQAICEWFMKRSWVTRRGEEHASLFITCKSFPSWALQPLLIRRWAVTSPTSTAITLQKGRIRQLSSSKTNLNLFLRRLF